mgnify:CR=1 FL=1
MRPVRHQAERTNRDRHGPRGRRPAMTRHQPDYSTALEIAIELVCSVALSCVLFLLMLGVLVYP